MMDANSWVPAVNVADCRYEMNKGAPTAVTIAMTATTTTSSIRLKPAALICRSVDLPFGGTAGMDSPRIMACSGYTGQGPVLSGPDNILSAWLPSCHPDGPSSPVFSM